MYTETTPDSNIIVTFMQQMIPHHQNAVNMAKLLLKQETPAKITAADAGLEDILNNIINTQFSVLCLKEVHKDLHGHMDLCLF